MELTEANKLNVSVNVLRKELIDSAQHMDDQSEKLHQSNKNAL